MKSFPGEVGQVLRDLLKKIWNYEKLTSSTVLLMGLVVEVIEVNFHTLPANCFDVR